MVVSSDYRYGLVMFLCTHVLNNNIILILIKIRLILYSALEKYGRRHNFVLEKYGKLQSHWCTNPVATIWLVMIHWCGVVQWQSSLLEQLTRPASSLLTMFITSYDRLLPATLPLNDCRASQVAAQTVANDAVTLVLSDDDYCVTTQQLFSQVIWVSEWVSV